MRCSREFCCLPDSAMVEDIIAVMHHAGAAHHAGDCEPLIFVTHLAEA